jgi:hypothetical protein
LSKQGKQGDGSVASFSSYRSKILEWSGGEEERMNLSSKTNTYNIHHYRNVIEWVRGIVIVNSHFIKNNGKSVNSINDIITVLIVSCRTWGHRMNKRYFWVWMIIAAVLSIFTGELVTFMMLFLILLTLNEIHSIVQKFHEDWKRKNSGF